MMRVLLGMLGIAVLLIAAIVTGAQIRERNRVAASDTPALAAGASSSQAASPVPRVARLAALNGIVRGAALVGSAPVFLVDRDQQLSLARVDPATGTVSNDPLGLPSAVARAALAAAPDGTLWIGTQRGADQVLVRIGTDGRRAEHRLPVATRALPRGFVATHPDGTPTQNGEITSLFATTDRVFVGRSARLEITVLDVAAGRFSTLPMPDGIGGVDRFFPGPSGSVLFAGGLSPARPMVWGDTAGRLDPATGAITALTPGGSYAVNGALVAYGFRGVGLLDADGAVVRAPVGPDVYDISAIALRDDGITIVRRGWSAAFVARDGTEVGAVSYAPPKLLTRSAARGSGAGRWDYALVAPDGALWFGDGSVYRVQADVVNGRIVLANPSPAPPTPTEAYRCDEPVTLPATIEQSSVFDAAWSPDGSRLAVVYRTGGPMSREPGHLAILELGNGTQREIPAARAPLRVAWSASGRLLTYSAGRDDGTLTAYLIDDGTWTERAVLEGVGRSWWSGDRFIYTRGNELRAWEAGSDVSLMTLPADFADADLEMSADGTRVLATRFTPDGTPTDSRWGQLGSTLAAIQPPAPAVWSSTGHALLLTYADRLELRDGTTTQSLARGVAGLALFGWDGAGQPLVGAPAPTSYETTIEFATVAAWNGSALSASIRIPSVAPGTLRFSARGDMVAVRVPVVRGRSVELWVFRCSGRIP